MAELCFVHCRNHCSVRHSDSCRGSSGSWVGRVSSIPEPQKQLNPGFSVFAGPLNLRIRAGILHYKRMTLPSAFTPPKSVPDVVRRAQGGDGAAFEQLYREHSPRVYALCLRLSGGSTEDATELLQDAGMARTQEFSRRQRILVRASPPDGECNA